MRRRYAWIDRQLVPLFAPNFHPATPIELIPMPPPGRELREFMRWMDERMQEAIKPLAPPAPVAVTAPKPVE